MSAPMTCRPIVELARKRARRPRRRRARGPARRRPGRRAGRGGHRLLRAERGRGQARGQQGFRALDLRGGRRGDGDGPLVRHASAARSSTPRTLGVPVVVKADGLAGGKGVAVCATLAEAERAIRDALERGRFGSAGETVVVEHWLRGVEASVIALCDGERLRAAAGGARPQAPRRGRQRARTRAAWAPTRRSPRSTTRSLARDRRDDRRAGAARDGASAARPSGVPCSPA